MDLSKFNNSDFSRGRSFLCEVLWVLFGSVLFSSFLPGSSWRKVFLVLFGAEIGHAVVIKPRVRVKFPWRLVVKDHVWIGEGVWIDNLATVTLHSHSCVSQGVYICTGSHDWAAEDFPLITKPVVVESCAWVGAFSRIAPGVVVSYGSICSIGSVLTKSTGQWEVWSGNPASVVRLRKMAH